MLSRRRFIGAALATGGTVATGAALTPLLGAASATAADATAVAFFTRPMPLPQVIAPSSTANGVDTYNISIKRTTKEILPKQLTEVFTFNGGFPGLIRATSGRPVVINQYNKLDMPASIHLHGGHVAPEHDGDPMATIAPGGVRTYHYPNQQGHAPLWLHDHAHHMESEHVYRGLSAFYLLTDAEERALPLPSGVYDVPIMLREGHFDTAGQLVYTMDDFRSRSTIMANGRAWPYFQVAARKYRFRLLNSTNLRFFTLRLADGSPFIQIGSDGGLLERPFSTDTVALSPGERAEVVIDFSRYPVGTQLVLENTEGPGPAELTGKVLRFDVVKTASDPSAVPATLRTLPALPAVTGRRTVVMSMDEDGRPAPQGYMDGKVYDHHRIDNTVPWGGSEIWTVTNSNQAIPHNFHIHLVQFRVLERNGNPPGPAEAGLKDTIRVMPGETVKFQATFDSYRGKYLYHCHMLDHAAMGMMAQMEVV
ncbi:multicopper oxidase family protein [Streptomyces sp. NPDC056222]|uniref:multicopper oxidase family protein n=1 Tax=Streptomyces sp. NPDC056222 TaxID=3345749 RepID=UPI0035E10A83